MAYEKSTLEETVPFQETAELPRWAEGDLKQVEQYYHCHQETYFDRFIRYLVSHLGIIVHGNYSQEQLSTHLLSFDIKKLLSQGPSEHPVLSLAAQQLIYGCLSKVDKVIDTHLHNLGYDEGNYLNPKILDTWKDYFTFLVLRYASGMTSPVGSTQAARQRMQLYAAHFPKLYGMVLPIHKAILADGTEDWSNTGNFLTNHSAWETTSSFHQDGSELISAVSIHPFDREWREKMFKAYAKGIRIIKWMPPQSIPPDSELLHAYYQTMKELGMALIAHAGPEHAIPTNAENEKWADWGNPLRFRLPLQMGVNVILAHCGHEDAIADLDDPNQPKIPGYLLFFRLAKEARQKNLTGEWLGKLYGDLAAVTTHYGAEMVRLLILHANEDGFRLFYGSDYPYTNLITPNHDAYEKMAQYGLLDPQKIKPLKEIRAWNPLLANFVFTANLEAETETGNNLRFPASAFTGQFADGELKFFELANP